MSIVNHNSDLIDSSHGNSNLHLPSVDAGLTLTEMLDPAFDHLWLDFDASKHYPTNKLGYNGTLCSDSLPSIHALNIIYSKDPVAQSSDDSSGFRGSPLLCVATNDLADDGITRGALPPYIAALHSPHFSIAPRPDALSGLPHTTYRSVSASTLFSGFESGLQNKWHTAYSQTCVAPALNVCTEIVYNPPFAPSRSSKQLFTDQHDQQSSYNSQSNIVPNYAPSPPTGVREVPPTSPVSNSKFFGLTYDGAAVGPLGVPTSDMTTIAGGSSKLSSKEQTHAPQNRRHFTQSPRRSRDRNVTLDGGQSSFQHQHTIPEQHVGRSNDVLLPSALCQTLNAHQSCPLVSQPGQYPYVQYQTKQMWSFPGSSIPCNAHWEIMGQLVGSCNQCVRPLRMQDWTSYHPMAEPEHLLSESRSTSSSDFMSDSEYSPKSESTSSPESSSLVQRHSRHSKPAAVVTKPYSRKNLQLPGKVSLRKADIFNPNQPIQCTLRIERGDRKGQKCNTWCKGVDAFTRHLRDDFHNYSPCKRPPSQSPGPGYVPEDNGLPMEWGFCTWEEDNDCKTFKTRRSNNRLGPMSGGDLIRHIRELHAGIPR